MVFVRIRAGADPWNPKAQFRATCVARIAGLVEPVAGCPPGRTDEELNREVECGTAPLGRRSVRFASGDAKGVAMAQPRTRDVKIGARALPVNASSA